MGVTQWTETSFVRSAIVRPLEPPPPIIDAQAVLTDLAPFHRAVSLAGAAEAPSCGWLECLFLLGQKMPLVRQ